MATLIERLTKRHKELKEVAQAPATRYRELLQQARAGGGELKGSDGDELAELADLLNLAPADVQADMGALAAADGYQKAIEEARRADAQDLTLPMEQALAAVEAAQQHVRDLRGAGMIAQSSSAAGAHAQQALTILKEEHPRLFPAEAR
jgi:hypothetical protein